MSEDFMREIIGVCAEDVAGEIKRQKLSRVPNMDRVALKLNSVATSEETAQAKRYLTAFCTILQENGLTIEPTKEPDK